MSTSSRSSRANPRMPEPLSRVRKRAAPLFPMEVHVDTFYAPETEVERSSVPTKTGDWAASLPVLAIAISALAGLSTWSTMIVAKSVLAAGLVPPDMPTAMVYVFVAGLQVCVALLGPLTAMFFRPFRIVIQDRLSAKERKYAGVSDINAKTIAMIQTTEALSRLAALEKPSADAWLPLAYGVLPSLAIFSLGLFTRRIFEARQRPVGLARLQQELAIEQEAEPILRKLVHSRTRNWLRRLRAGFRRWDREELSAVKPT